MFKLDDNFLNELGLGALPPQDKDPMKAHIYETLELRVGMKLASNMTDAQLDEFEALMSTDAVKVQAFLSNWDPNWEQNQEYVSAIEQARKAVEARGGVFDEQTKNSSAAEFAALKWLETNFPNYKQVVAEELDKLKAEVKAAAPQILEASRNRQQQ